MILHHAPPAPPRLPLTVAQAISVHHLTCRRCRPGTRHPQCREARRLFAELAQAREAQWPAS